MTSPAPEAPISSARKWAITFTVMVVAFMQILDTSVTNVDPPAPSGLAIGGAGRGVVGDHLLSRRQRRHHPGDRVAGRPLRPPAILPDLRHPVRRQLVRLGRRPRPDHLDRGAHLPGSRRRADHSALAGDPLGDLPVPPARARDGGVGRSASSSARSWDRPSAAIWPTSGRGAGSSTSTCPSGSLGFFLASVFLFDPPYLRRSRADRLVGPGSDGRRLRVPAARPRPGRARGLVRLVARSSP